MQVKSNFIESHNSYSSHYSFLTDKYNVVLHGFTPLKNFETSVDDSVRRKDDGKLTTFTSFNSEELITESIKLSNRFSLLSSDLLSDSDLKARVINLNYSHSLNAPYDIANFTLEMSLPELLKSMHGTPINAFSFNQNTLLSRFIRTGGWVSILQNDRLVFFGNIDSFSSSLSFAGDLITQSVQVSCVSWVNNLMHSEIRQTSQKKEGLLSQVSPSAIIKSNDLKEGFLKVLVKNLNLGGEGNEPAQMLEDMIKALAHHKLPRGLVGGKINERLGDYIEVMDGTPSSLISTQYFNYSSQADQIKGNILAKYQSFTSNGISHWELIEQIFQGLPSIIELFAFTQPLQSEPKNALERSLGGKLCVMYRYKPCNPTYPPTANGLNRLLKRRTGIASKSATTNSELFFGEFKETNYFEIDVKTVIDFSFSYSEGEHINCVFIEAPYVNGDAHNSNIFRANASPIMNIGDVNRHGLKIFSTTTPFFANSSDTPAIKSFNQNSSNALAERIYHSMGMGHEFCTGSITVNVPYTEEFSSLNAGLWIKMKLGYLTEETEFTAYLESVNTSIQNNGDTLTKEITYSFSRGSFGNNVVLFEPNQFVIDKTENERKDNEELE